MLCIIPKLADGIQAWPGGERRQGGSLRAFLSASPPFREAGFNAKNAEERNAKIRKEPLLTWRQGLRELCVKTFATFALKGFCVEKSARKAKMCGG